MHRELPCLVNRLFPDFKTVEAEQTMRARVWVRRKLRETHKKRKEKRKRKWKHEHNLNVKCFVVHSAGCERKTG